jgi:hypothetical protein
MLRLCACRDRNLKVVVMPACRLNACSTGHQFYHRAVPQPSQLLPSVQARLKLEVVDTANVHQSCHSCRALMPSTGGPYSQCSLKLPNNAGAGTRGDGLKATAQPHVCMVDDDILSCLTLSSRTKPNSSAIGQLPAAMFACCCMITRRQLAPAAATLRRPLQRRKSHAMRRRRQAALEWWLSDALRRPPPAAAGESVSPTLQHGSMLSQLNVDMLEQHTHQPCQLMKRQATRCQHTPWVQGAVVIACELLRRMSLCTPDMQDRC